MDKNSVPLTQRNSLTQWLDYLETIHSSEIDLGLERIAKVGLRLAIDFSFAKVITVAGTNGKGTTCAFLENALLSDGYSVAVYSSPHIDQFNERLRLDKLDVDDSNLIQAFVKVEQARADISLSYYEYTTLAVFVILMDLRPDIIILEVGLGGRLDATNIIDADIAVITTVDLDHQAFLGNDREAIGFEKAGIMRSAGLAVIGDGQPPTSVLQYAEKLGALVKIRQQDFWLEQQVDTWQWCYGDVCFSGLNLPHIPQDNVATALMVLSLLDITLSSAKINDFIEKTRVVGRLERFQQDCDVLLDVAHNPQAARYLAQQLRQKKVKHGYTRVIAVVAMLADKDITNSLLAINSCIDQWYIGELKVDRTASADFIAEQVSKYSSAVNCFDNIVQAYRMASEDAEPNDLIVVFGSFFTVAEIRRLLI